MTRVFRLRRWVRDLGIFGAIFFSAATIGCSLLPLLADPAARDYPGARSAAVIAGMGAAVFGGALLISIYTLVAYRVERLEIDATAVHLRSVFQNRQFEIHEVEKLIWKNPPASGRIIFRLTDSKNLRLDLVGFGSEDRLAIIRRLRTLVPEKLQDGWPRFCTRVALPLRDRIEHGTGASSAEIRSPATHFLATRRRWDRFFAIVIVISLSGAAVFWGITGLPHLFGFLPTELVLWLVMRFLVPKEGSWEQKISLANSEHRTLLLMFSAMGVSIAVMCVARLAGLKGDVPCVLSLLVMGPVTPIVIYRLYKHDKQRTRREAVTNSQNKWDGGEKNLVAEGSPADRRTNNQLREGSVEESIDRC